MRPLSLLCPTLAEAPCEDTVYAPMTRKPIFASSTLLRVVFVPTTRCSFFRCFSFENQTVGAYTHSGIALQVPKYLCKRDRDGHGSSSISRWLTQAYTRFESPRVHSMDEMAIPLHKVCAILETSLLMLLHRCPENEDSGSKITLIAGQTPKIRREWHVQNTHSW